MSEAKTKYKVVMADDEYVARTLFEMLIQSTVNFELSASFSTAEQVVNYCRTNEVDLVILDVMMKKGLDGLTCAETIKSNNSKIKVILATSTGEYKWIEEAKREKIDSFWFKEYHESSLLDIMDRTMNGESVYPDVPPNPEFGSARKADLTEREQDVLRELTRNFTNEEIASRLNISVNTVRTHIQHMLEKTGYRTRIDLAVNAKALGVVVHEDDRTGNRPQKGGN